jgi:hypothetical protein
MDNFTVYEKSGAVWMFGKPEWDVAEIHCYSKKVFKRGEALAEFVHTYDIKPGDTVIEFRAADNKVTPIPLIYVPCL